MVAPGVSDRAVDRSDRRAHGNGVVGMVVEARPGLRRVPVMQGSGVIVSALPGSHRATTVSLNGIPRLRRGAPRLEMSRRVVRDRVDCGGVDPPTSHPADSEIVHPALLCGISPRTPDPDVSEGLVRIQGAYRD